MSAFPDDTALDAIAAQVRSIPRIDDAQLGALLREARDAPAGPAAAALVEQQLGSVLDAVLSRRAAEVDLLDLYQEGSVAATVAVGEYASHGGSPEGMRAYVDRLVATFLDDVIEREASLRRADALLLERVQLLEAAEVTLRHRLARQPTTLELAAALQWSADEVTAVAAVLAQARETYDAEILPFLDDLDGDEAG